MVGLPVVCHTKEDFTNSVEYALTHPELKGEMITRLESLRDNHTKLVLKAEAEDKDVEEQTLDDYEAVDDPAALKYRLGVSDAWIEALIRRLK